MAQNGHSLKDISGQKFNRLKVIEISHRNKHGVVYWRCICDCGNTTTVISARIRSGTTVSCGCYLKELLLARKTHGKTRSPIYSVWSSMMTRCTNRNNHTYKSYGGRGISVCERWLKFENFYTDMGDIPEGMTLERINNDEGYSPNNCIWATKTEQARNRRSSHNITHNGKTQCLMAWEHETGVKRETIARRLKIGWDIEVALYTKPLRVRRRGVQSNDH